MFASVTRIAHDHSDQVNEWGVQQEVEHRHFVEDQHRAQQQCVRPSMARRRSNAVPSVIRRNRSDGGYLLVFGNESAVKSADFWMVHLVGSP